MQNDTHERLDYLDSLRGIASIVVFGSHFVGAYGLPPSWVSTLNRNPVSGLWDGFAAVSLFFVLSGFVLSLKLFSPRARSETRDWLVTYFIARIFRIGPPYVCAVILSAIAMRFLFDMSEMSLRPTEWVLGFWKHEISVRQLVRDAFLLEQVNERRLVPQGWTLAVELKFSLLIPFLVLIYKQGLRWFIAFVLICTVLLSVNYFMVHFALGVAVAAQTATHPRSFAILNKIGKILLLGIGFALLTVQSWSGLISTQVTFLISGLGASLLLVSCLSWASVQASLTKRALLFLGRISFSFYLLHMIVICCAIPPLVRALPWYHEIGTRAVALVVAGVATVILSVPFYYLVERPSIRIGKKIAHLLGRNASPANREILEG